MKFTYKNILLIFFIAFQQVTYGQFVKQKPVKKSGTKSEMYRSQAFDGAWCWFSDSRAVYHKGLYQRTYTGWIDSYGDIFISAYNHVTGETESVRLYDDFEIDDHDNPAIMIDKEGYLWVFFSKHSSNEPIHFFKSKFPENIRDWCPEKLLDLNDTVNYPNKRNSYTYCNPVQLSAENDKVFLFWRGIDGKPTFSTSTDKGESWTKGKIFIFSEPKYNFRRPYVKIFSSGKDKIHILFTDGHPAKEIHNSVYYMFYKSGAFYKADGTKINDADKQASPREADVVYDAATTNQRAWIWDIAEDEEGNPVIAYTKFSTATNHTYCYARWNDSEWVNADLINSGSWFPSDISGKVQSEPYYSGGMSIDKETPGVLYVSIKRDSIFEIEKWSLKSEKKWTVENITKGSSKHNVRPFAVRGASNDNPLQLLWMQNTRYYHYGLKGNDFNERYLTSIKSSLPSPVITDFMDSTQIVEKMWQVADWQLSNPDKSLRTDWLWGAFYVGLAELYKQTKDVRYLNEILNIGHTANWQPQSEILNADKLVITESWATVYDMIKNPKMIEKTKFALDIAISRKLKNITLVHDRKNNPNALDWWSWCDALYMAPPAYAHISKITGDKKYIDYMSNHWWKTSDYLYSKEDSLYYRDDRYFASKTINGKKMFWSRGNGWVVGGLVRVLTYMPENYPKRNEFECQFREMTTKLLSLQRPDGLWTTSLLDPEEIEQTESSGSAFFIYAIAWGINNGIIDKSYISNIKKAWVALSKNINSDGRLGYVQQIAAKPGSFQEDQWQVYASGTYFLAGIEMIKLLNK